MKATSVISLLFILTIILITGCQKDDDLESHVKKERISGYVQKGPFISGTGISISELDKNLTQTGKVFMSQISDNKGTFEITDIELISKFASLRADGFYYNEILGKQSSSQVTLFAVTDISDKDNININILSHLEKARVEYLISAGSSFSDAKKQAQKEILAIFNIDKEDINFSENLDISKEGDDNGILLAISLILQGFRTEGELTELLSNISGDIKEDGILDNNSLGSALINHAVYINAITVRNNLANRYAELGDTTEIPDFEKYIAGFISETDYPVTEYIIEYPETGMYGRNILYPSDTVYSGKFFSLAANLAEGTSLKIKINGFDSAMWFYALGSSYNWSITIFDDSTKSQEFTAIESDHSCDLNMLFDNGKFLIEYFEMGASSPTRTKTIIKK